MDRRSAERRELPARRRAPARRVSTPRSASRSAARRGVVGVMEFFSREPARARASGCSSSIERPRQPGRPVRRPPAGRGGGASRASRACARCSTAALDAIVTMRPRGRRHRLEPRGRDGPSATRARRGDRSRDGRPDRAADAARWRTDKGIAALPRDRDGRMILDRRVELDRRCTTNGSRVSRRADDHADRRCPGAPHVHGLPARHHRPQARRCSSCGPRARASSRSPTPSAGASSATSTTARSSG